MWGGGGVGGGMLVFMNSAGYWPSLDASLSDIYIRILIS